VVPGVEIMDYHHAQTVANGIHIAHSFEYVNAQARELATDVLPTDVNKLALQLNDRTMWMLAGVSPTVWQKVSLSDSEQAQLSILLQTGGNAVAFKSVEANGKTFSASPSESNLVISGVEGVRVDISSDNKLELGFTPEIVGKLAIAGNHGSLSGLNLDHHVQYLNVTRHQKAGLHELVRVIGGITYGCVPHDDLDGLTNVTINNSTLQSDQVLSFNGGFWQNASIPLATSLKHGLMSKTDKVALTNLIGSSDERLKTHVAKLSDSVNALSIIKKLETVSFNWVDSANRGQKREIGLMAQQVEPLLPFVVREDGEGFKTIDYAKLTVVLIDAVNMLQERVESLQDQICRLMVR